MGFSTAFGHYSRKPGYMDLISPTGVEVGETITGFQDVRLRGIQLCSLVQVLYMCVIHCGGGWRNILCSASWTKNYLKEAKEHEASEKGMGKSSVSWGQVCYDGLSSLNLIWVAGGIYDFQNFEKA
jgi:hypothetical protein